MELRNNFEKIKEYKLIVMYILKGLSNTEIARNLNYSRSTVTYKISKIFQKFNSKNRFEFAIKVLSDIIQKKEKTLEAQNEDIIFLKKENEKIKKLLAKVIKERNDKEKAEKTIKKALEYIK